VKLDTLQPQYRKHIGAQFKDEKDTEEAGDASQPSFDNFIHGGASTH